MTELTPQQRMWTIGDYPTVARHLLPISEQLVEQAGVTAGQRVLDVAVGDGNAAILAARRGASVVGVDLTPAQIDRARARCLAEGVDVDLRIGDAEALDVGDGEFDVVVSAMGVIFAPNHERAAAELARAVRPGGTVAITAWYAEGFSLQWRAKVKELFPDAPDEPLPQDEWGIPEEAARRLAAVGLEPEVTVRPFDWRFPNEEVALATFLEAAGPFVMFMEAATAMGVGDEARAAAAAAVHEANEATDGTCRLPAPYVLVIASRPAGDR